MKFMLNGGYGSAIIMSEVRYVLEKILPFIVEFIIFLLIVIGLIVFFTITKSIIFVWSTPLILFVILVAVWFLQYIFSFVPFAILVITDAILKNYEAAECTFIEQFIYARSTTGTCIFTSSEYYELKQNVKYTFVYGRKSHVLVDIKKDGSVEEEHAKEFTSNGQTIIVNFYRFADGILRLSDAFIKR